MSGGHFDYREAVMYDIADTIREVIRDNYETSLNEYGDRKGRWLTDDTIMILKKTIKKLDKALLYVHRIDYLLSGDDSEESFHRRIREDLEALSIQRKIGK